MANDFSKGKIAKIVLIQSFPLMVAQLVHLLYNIVDRIYIGHLSSADSLALTGIGLAFPLTTLIAAFTNMFGQGGAPIFSIARGAGDEKKAEKVLSQVCCYLFVSSFILFAFCYAYRKPILYLFGASDASYVYAEQYLSIYLFGTTFAMVSTGLNNYINAQGFPKMGMMTIVLGAILNLILDPIFIFVFKMGVRGAALATVLSQGASFVWVLLFFYGKQTLYRFKKEYMIPDFKLMKEICALGFANFIMQGTNTLVAILCNVTLRTFGGDIYVAIMTVINSVREILSLPAQSVTHASQPVMSFNYGAKKYSRVKQTIRFITFTSIFYLVSAWLCVILKPEWLISLFSKNADLIEPGKRALKLYFCGFAFMAFQNAGQSSFTAMKCTKRAIFFSLLRKVVIVAPLTLILPRLGLGVDGVWLAEPISNLLGGCACYIVMFFTLYKKLPEDGMEMK